MTKDMWMFLAIWNGVSSVYWYVKFKRAMIVFSDPVVLEKALQILKEWEKDD